VDADGPHSVACKRLFVSQSQGDGGDNGTCRAIRDDVQAVDRDGGLRVSPIPEKVGAGPAGLRLRLSKAGAIPGARPAIPENVLLIGAGQERELTPGGDVADL